MFSPLGLLSMPYFSAARLSFGVEGAALVRVPIMAPPRYAMRTISIGATLNGVLQGTPGNDDDYGLVQIVLNYSLRPRSLRVGHCAD